MLGDLVKFNMTNDIQLSVDMRAGQEPGTTDYEIFVQEPDPRTFTLFSDSSGSKSSGRYRGGVSFTERSLLGWRDRLQLIGVFPMVQEALWVLTLFRSIVSEHV